MATAGQEQARLRLRGSSEEPLGTHTHTHRHTHAPQTPALLLSVLFALSTTSEKWKERKKHEPAASSRRERGGDI